MRRLRIVRPRTVRPTSDVARQIGPYVSDSPCIDRGESSDRGGGEVGDTSTIAVTGATTGDADGETTTIAAAPTVGTLETQSPQPQRVVDLVLRKVETRVPQPQRIVDSVQTVETRWLHPQRVVESLSMEEPGPQQSSPLEQQQQPRQKHSLSGCKPLLDLRLRESTLQFDEDLILGDGSVVSELRNSSRSRSSSSEDCRRDEGMERRTQPFDPDIVLRAKIWVTRQLFVGLWVLTI